MKQDTFRATALALAAAALLLAAPADAEWWKQGRNSVAKHFATPDAGGVLKANLKVGLRALGKMFDADNSAEADAIFKGVMRSYGQNIVRSFPVLKHGMDALESGKRRLESAKRKIGRVYGRARGLVVNARPALAGGKRKWDGRSESRTVAQPEPDPWAPPPRASSVSRVVPAPTIPDPGGAYAVRDDVVRGDVHGDRDAPAPRPGGYQAAMRALETKEADPQGTPPSASPGSRAAPAASRDDALEAAIEEAERRAAEAERQRQEAQMKAQRSTETAEKRRQSGRGDNPVAGSCEEAAERAKRVINQIVQNQKLSNSAASAMCASVNVDRAAIWGNLQCLNDPKWSPAEKAKIRLQVEEYRRHLGEAKRAYGQLTSGSTCECWTGLCTE